MPSYRIPCVSVVFYCCCFLFMWFWINVQSICLVGVRFVNLIFAVFQFFDWMLGLGSCFQNSNPAHSTDLISTLRRRWRQREVPRPFPKDMFLNQFKNMKIRIPKKSKIIQKWWNSEFAKNILNKVSLSRVEKFCWLTFRCKMNLKVFHVDVQKCFCS